MNDIGYSVSADSGKAFNLHLNNFEGPLDMLLYMVKEAKIEIVDIFVSGITDEFLRYMSDIEDLDVDSASEYMAMTATLLEIKSKALLPVTEEPTDEEDPERELIRRLEEYKLMKEASEKLKKIENVASLYKHSSVKVEPRFSAKDFTLESLVEAFARVMQKYQIDKLVKTQPKEIRKDVFTVEQKVVFLQNKLRTHKRLSFFELFEDDCDVGEVVVTFSALLQLMKQNFVLVKQNKCYGDISIAQNPKYKPNNADVV
ncbi:MAG: segregation/condensation protein A [Clostridia bacterium]|nr:segregation/condensation protein A [Clostridia bacterium]